MLSCILFLSFSLIFYLCEGAHDLEENCQVWAQSDNECNKNPRYMWEACQASCMEFAKDDNQRCHDWGLEGECTKNPGYIHVHCPETCQVAAGWSPWVRRALEIFDITSRSDMESVCTESSHAFGAAEVLRERLSIFLSGSSIKGMSDSSPSEFTGMAGLAESALYIARIYKSILSSDPNATKVDE
eukprot:gene17656-36217_t